MPNVDMVVKGKGVVITIADADAEFGVSPSGKTISVANSGGFTPIALPSGKVIKISVNATAENPNKIADVAAAEARAEAVLEAKAAAKAARG